MSRAHRQRLRHDWPILMQRRMGPRTFYATNRVFRMLLRQLKRPKVKAVRYTYDGRTIMLFNDVPIRRVAQ